MGRRDHLGISPAILDPASALKWTVGAFWSLAKETSIEELHDPQINQFLTALYGEDSAAIFGPFYSCNGQGTPQTFPNCDIYYNNNQSYDRQLAGFGEVTYGVTDRLKFTAGGRFAKMSFSLAHYADGMENFGPDHSNGDYHENAFTPKLGVSFQMDPNNFFYATYAKGFRPGGVNPPLPGGYLRWHAECVYAGPDCGRLSATANRRTLQVGHHQEL